MLGCHEPVRVCLWRGHSWLVAVLFCCRAAVLASFRPDGIEAAARWRTKTADTTRRAAARVPSCTQLTHARTQLHAQMRCYPAVLAWHSYRTSPQHIPRVLTHAAVKAIAAPSSGGAEGLKLVEKAKAAVSAVKVAQALDAIAGLLEKADAAKAAGADGIGSALKSADTLQNLSAYLTLYK